MISNKTVLGIKGTLSYTVDEGHPDYGYMTDKQKHGINRVSDTYKFDLYDPQDNPAGYWDPDNLDGMIDYVRHDLALVAGGGYSTAHIHNVKLNVVPA